jgi:hypothetical protein
MRGETFSELLQMFSSILKKKKKASKIQNVRKKKRKMQQAEKNFNSYFYLLSVSQQANPLCSVPHFPHSKF